MSTVCYRCALRIRAATTARKSATGGRAFTTSTANQRQPLPQFTPTSQPELDEILASVRDKWLIPSALTTREKKLVHKPRNKQYLQDNEEIVPFGEEDVRLHHINLQTDMPSLKRELLPKVIDRMANGEQSDWNNLPALLIGLKRAKLTPKYDLMGKIARKAIEVGRFGIILRCLQQSELTQMALYKEDVLNNVIYGLRDIAQKDGWSEAATSKAIRDANEVATMLEDEAHGGGRVVRAQDPVARPEIIAVYLELFAVHAYKHTDRKDVDGKVKAYTQRLLSNMQWISRESGEDKSLIRPASHVPEARGPQKEILRGVPIYHGLRLATEILGADMPMPELAQRVVKNWQEGLTALTEGVRNQAKEKAHGKNRWPASGTHGWKALKVWRSCIV